MPLRRYLDHNAGGPLRPEAHAAIAAALGEVGNPSSVHAEGRRARATVERARAQVAALVGASPRGIVFTSGGTEANHLAILGCRRPRVLVSAVEHPSALLAEPDAVRVPVDGEGVVELGALEALVAAETAPAVVSVMLANNETGVLQPVAEAARLAHRHGALLHVDAAQAAGRVPVDVTALDADLLTLSAHKLGGPQGVGALVVRDGIDVMALQRGGGQELGRRAGTEPVALIAGFGAAAEAAARDEAGMGRLAAMRDGMEAAILERVPEVRIPGRGAARLPNTSAIAMPGVASATQVMAFDLDGLAVSAGAACSSGRVGPSHVLAAMGLEPAIAGTAVRVSFGWTSQDDHPHEFVRSWLALYERCAERRKAA